MVVCVVAGKVHSHSFAWVLIVVTHFIFCESEMKLNAVFAQ